MFKSFLVMMFQKHAKLSVRCNNYETKVIYRYTLYFSTLITPMRSRVYAGLQYLDYSSRIRVRINLSN